MSTRYAPGARTPQSLCGKTLSPGKECQMSLSYKFVPSPIGDLKLVASDKGLVAILWKNDRPGRVRLEDLAEDANHPVLLQTERQLTEYFAGQRRMFELPLDMRGTPFQKQVWEQLLAIPFGRFG